MSRIKLIVLTAITVLLAVSCKEEAVKADRVKVGMVTDAGTIDDKSFNQGTWEGILRAQEELNIEAKYLKPTGTTEADYLKEIGNLHDAGYRLIITPGFKFQTAIEKAQDKYTDTKFVLLDAAPTEVKDNTVAIFFAEHEAGFVAGVATALELQDGSVGFIGGMEIPPVQKFNWGFQQGINYANNMLNTTIEMNPENIIYQGTFNDVAAGQALAAQMYDKGVDAIFCAAGGVGVGAINEAKSRAVSGEKVWVVGVDTDQYDEGLYDGENSVILTSALKRIDTASFVMIISYLGDKLPGGKTITFNAVNDGVGIPEENPNLSKEVTDKVKEIYSEIQLGNIKISDTQGDLIK